jgi:hypothetical protein
VEEVDAPARVAPLDLAALLSGASARPAAPGGSPADEALLACFEQAETPEALTACGEPA